jgi:APA family basic amino acid/polyamine antiporter
VTIAVGVLVAFLAAFFNISFLGELVSLGTLLAFTIVCVGVWVMRKKQPEVARPFRTPWVPFVPIMGILIALALMVSSDTPAKVGFVSWLILGLLIYFGYSTRHSKVQRAHRKTTAMD